MTPTIFRSISIAGSLTLVACGGASAPPAEHAEHAHGHAPSAHDHGQAGGGGSETTASFRAHHAEIRVKLDEASSRAMALPSASPEELGDRIHEIVHFFHHELIPHAEAEEQILYAAADRLVPTERGRRYTDSLRYEHTVVAREVQWLHDTMESGDRSPARVTEIQRRTLELVGLVKAHFGAEEDVILAAFDDLMSPEDFQREVVEPMHAASAEAGGEEHEHAEEHGAEHAH